MCNSVFQIALLILYYLNVNLIIRIIKLNGNLFFLLQMFSPPVLPGGGPPRGGPGPGPMDGNYPPGYKPGK